MSVATGNPPTRILENAPLVTEINFLHLEENSPESVGEEVVLAAEQMTKQAGFVAVNVLRSTDDSRLCTYVQWESAALLEAAHASLGQPGYRGVLLNDAKPRLYDVHYAHDVSPEGHSVISEDYRGVIFINEITTVPGAKQYRLLEMVVANNERDSLRTPGYRSANFHRSHDGERAVNYSLWDTEEHLVSAISSMAEEDTNLDETVEIASPDFRFYTLIYVAHA